MAKHWYLITIEDPNCLCDGIVPTVIEFISKQLNIQYVNVGELEFNRNPHEIRHKEYIDNLLDEDKILTLNEFLESSKGVSQFIWGDFYLFRNLPKDWSRFKREPYPDTIIYTDTTVRAIDNGAIDIITPYKEICESIREKNYKIQSYTEGSLEDFTYPF